MEDIKLINNDCLIAMKELSNGSVHCVITSPPYNVDLGNNKYKKDGYSTHNDNMPYDDYLDWMKEVFKECYRVLSHDGRICVNIGDAKKRKKQPKTYEEFKAFVESNSAYMYWSRCQYELVLKPWVGHNKEKKVDVHWQLMHNLDLVTSILMLNLGFKENNGL